MMSSALRRAFSTTRVANTKVAVLGAAGGIGQPLSLLLKLQPDVSALSLYDVSPLAPGVAADLSHINSKAKISGYKGPEQLADPLKGAEVVVIPAGVPRKPGMTRDDLFNTNASIVAGLADACAKYCPKAHILIISNPVNSTVPIAAEILKRHGVYDPKRLFGVTTLDVLRANTFLAESQGWNPSTTDVTVIGGHAGITILPILSATGAKLTSEQIAALSNRIQFGGDEVVKAKDGAGSATLSMAVAAERFVASLLKAMNGAKDVSECAYVQSPVLAGKGVEYFSTRVKLSKDGVADIQPIPAMSEFEAAGLEKAIPELKSSIEKGISFAKAWQPK
jgi:malate dehydrogenase